MTAYRPAEEPGDGRGWVVGRCVWWCGRDGVEVVWIGDVASSGMHAPLFACGDCAGRFDALVWEWARRRDGVLRLSGG